MTVKLGYADLKKVILTPATWDLTYLKQFSLRDGTTFDQVVMRFGTALALFNRSLTAGYWAQYFGATTQIEKEYMNGGNSTELNEYSEMERPDPIIGDATGHMIPMKDYGGALGWTYLALRRARLFNLETDIAALIDLGRNTWQKKLLERLFKSNVVTVGTTGKSVPLADGGTADATYIPPSFDGKHFDATHNHYLRYTADAAGRSSAIDAMINTLAEHGITGPYDMVVSEADIASWTAQTEFKKPERGVLATAGVEARARVPEETYLGIVEGDRGWARIVASARVPTNYAGMFKPLGHGNVNNPLVVRYEEGYPLGLSIVAMEEKFPFADAISLLTFGVGIANRVNGTCTYFNASGNYVDPTIS